jgi:hypothetical protein
MSDQCLRNVIDLASARIVGQHMLPTRDPVRGTSRRSFRAKTRSLKNGRFIKCESLLEMRASWLFELVDGIESYTEQPSPLMLKLDKGRRRSRYTPDFFLKWKDGAPWFVEVKPQELATSDHWKRKFSAAGISAIAKGCHFVILTEEHLEAAVNSEIQQALEARHRRYVENLGEPRGSSEPATEQGDFERRALNVLSQAFESSPSIRILRTLGVSDQSSPFERGVCHGTPDIPERRPTPSRPSFSTGLSIVGGGA